MVYPAAMDFSAVTILCVGDVMLDRFVHGAVERISPEAPVPVLRLTRTDEMLGGTGNVAHNVASLGGRAVLIGLIGRDDAARSLRTAIAAVPGILPALVETSYRPTIRKTRYVAGQQQLVRADEEGLAPTHADEAVALRAAIDAHLPAADALVLSDYGKGVLSPEIVAHAIAAARAAGKPVFVDPKGEDFSRYRGATCITPNLRELAEATRLPVGDEVAAAHAAEIARATADADAILVTRSARGMLLAERDGSIHVIPARARAVFDVSGAGDTVIATLALAHAGGRTLAQAMHIANAAAGVVVSKPGTATADIAEVLHELDQVDEPVSSGLIALPRLLDRVAAWRARGLLVGFTNGCFDILHPGHVGLLAAARAACDRLIVALNTDDGVRRLKGPMRPVNDLDSRARVMAALRSVDAVVGFAEETPLELIRRIRPDILVKGGDYTIATTVGADIVIASGGRVVLPDLLAGHSTTATIARIDARG